MLRRIVRGGLRRFDNWIAKESDDEGPGRYDSDFSYPDLNRILTRMIDDGFRVPYAWGLLQAAALAKSLGVSRISALEFGVAGGNGLVALEQIAERLETLFPVTIDIYGFDTGAGLPPVTDYRDVPNIASTGLYVMDQAKLRSRLKRSKLVLGDVKNTVPAFAADKPAPIGFLACDLILYTSTVGCLQTFDADEASLLPRVHCVFDDVLGFSYGDCNGQRLAIHEFNQRHAMRKVSPMYGLRHYVPRRCFNDMWVEKIWLGHIFDHSQYGKRDHLVKQHDLSLSE
jgi:hypothetical protein